MVEKYDLYEAKWRDEPDTARWLRRMTVGTSSAAFPQGMQSYGDIGIDVDESVNPDIIGDINNPPFQNRTIDTVYVDPPYSLCAYDKIHGWLPSMWEITNKRLIVNMPQVDYNLPDSKYRLFYEHNGTGTMHLPLFNVWDRNTAELSDY